MDNTANVISDIGNVLTELMEENASSKLIDEYQTALLILRNPSIKSSKKLSHVISDLQLSIEFDEARVTAYKQAIEILKNASK